MHGSQLPRELKVRVRGDDLALYRGELRFVQWASLLLIIGVMTAACVEINWLRTRVETLEGKLALPAHPELVLSERAIARVIDVLREHPLTSTIELHHSGLPSPQQEIPKSAPNE